LTQILPFQPLVHKNFVQYQLEPQRECIGKVMRQVIIKPSRVAVFDGSSLALT